MWQQCSNKMKLVKENHFPIFPLFPLLCVHYTVLSFINVGLCCEIKSITTVPKLNSEG